MKTEDTNFTAQQAKRWAIDNHERLLFMMPPEIANNIDWEGVATDLQAQLSDVPMDFRNAVRRVVDYCYDFAAEDYATADHHDHAFDYVCFLRNWLRLESELTRVRSLAGD